MYWADVVATNLEGKGPQWVDDMKTPSGRIHVGSLRGVILHDVIFRALKDRGIEARYTYIFDDHDPMDTLPVYLEKEKFLKFMGQPLNTIPSPQPGFKNYAHFYAQEFIDVFHELGAHPEIIWASQLYERGKMNGAIKRCLDRAAEIRKIYQEIASSAKPPDWYPFNVICENCKKVGTTKVYNWDGEVVTYKCLSDLVTWVKGCGYEGCISPFNGNGKLPWKVEWGAKWQLIGVTVEGAGKDHMTAGGSHDIASAVCKRVLNYEPPYKFSYEFFLVGGKKMSSSKGLGSSAKEVSEIFPPAILRFLMIRSPVRTIDFDPFGETIPDLFDEYDRCAQAYFKEGRQSDFGRIFELSQVTAAGKEKVVLPRFRQVATYVQMPKLDVEKYFEATEKRALTEMEKDILKERIKYSEIWLDKYAPDEARYRVSEVLPKKAKDLLSLKQREYLKKIAEILSEVETPKELEFRLYEVAKSAGIASRDAFKSIYISLIGRDHGPKAAWLIMDLDREFVVARFREAACWPK